MYLLWDYIMWIAHGKEEHRKMCCDFFYKCESEWEWSNGFMASIKKLIERNNK